MAIRVFGKYDLEQQELIAEIAPPRLRGSYLRCQGTSDGYECSRPPRHEGVHAYYYYYGEGLAFPELPVLYWVEGG